MYATKLDDSNRLSSVSCPSASLCVGVGGAEEIVTSTDPTGGASRWSPVHLDGFNELQGVSCVSASLCVAVDNQGDVLASTDPTGGASRWSITHLEGLPAGSRSLLGLSCVSGGSGPLCAALDSAGDVVTSTDPTGGSGSWTLSDVDGESHMTGISCPSAELCVAGDSAGNVLTSTDPTGAGSWTVTVVDVHAIRSVSCSTESLCVAIDAAGNALTTTEPTMGKSAWSVAHIDPAEDLRSVFCTTGLCMALGGHGDALSTGDPTTGPAGWLTAHVDGANPVLLSVACPSAEFCAAVDNDDDAISSTNPSGGETAWNTRPLGPQEGPLLGLACPSTTLCVGAGESAVYTAINPASFTSTWTKELEYVLPAPDFVEGEEIFGPFAALSCASASLCVASLDSYDEYDELLTSTGPLGGKTAWASVAEGRIVGDGNSPPPDDEDPILGVSCASESLCAAVDLAGNVLTSTEPGSREAVWTRTPVDTNPLMGISCPSTQLCVAVDRAGNLLTSAEPTGGAAAWRVTDIDPGNRPTAVSCAAESVCVAVDAAGNTITSTNPTGGSGAWSVVPVDPGHALTSVSCTPAGLCVAVDNAGYAVTDTFPPSIEGGGGGQGDGGATAGGGATDVAVASPSSPPPSASSDALQVLHVRVKGTTIILTFRTPGPGTIAVRALTTAGGSASREKPRQHRKVTYATASTTVSEARTKTLAIKPRRSALRALKSARRVRVLVRVTFTTRDGVRQTESVSTTVALHAGHHSA